MRIQFDIDDGLWIRISRYVDNSRMRHYIARQALEEWLNRREGRDKKLQAEQVLTNAKLLIPLVRVIINTSGTVISDTQMKDLITTAIEKSKREY